ncbi:hypothetical protein [[Kitasatospora] papulosa]|uniref:hypothetical protein n=1 Tax=[Kitasatospora] papulosa TaxID=1464011 RepID=UPI0036EB42F3
MASHSPSAVAVTEVAAPTRVGCPLCAMPTRTPQDAATPDRDTQGPLQARVAVSDIGQTGQDEPGHEDQEQRDDQNEGEGERGHDGSPFRWVRSG